ncbi:MAG: response regulator [Candidatus Lokiarchaeota archaeon]|nr:response regulator [Candidatus Lokiarchaeota archaeon]
MKPLILVVEDDEDLLYDEILILELNSFEGISASNGQEALDKLKSMKRIPDLIISDIMMPIMNGYDFYKIVSSDPKYNTIPFIFLSAKSTPEDIRFGKYLGATDYLTKPFTEYIFINKITDMIQIHDKQVKIQEELDKKLELKKKDLTDRTKYLDPKESTQLLLVFWDDQLGPNLTHVYPEIKKDIFMLQKIALQLYNTSVGLYGFHGFYGAEGIHLKIANLKMDGYIFFDAFKDEQMRGGQQVYMIGVISPHIHYLASMRLKEELAKISQDLKQKKDINLEDAWEAVLSCL